MNMFSGQCTINVLKSAIYFYSCKYLILNEMLIMMLYLLYLRFNFDATLFS